MKTILLIDDDESIRVSFGMALRQHGYRLIEADSGDAGLEAAKQFLPDLILTDINMPGGDGQALLQKIRQCPELNAKQVVLMTGRPDLVPPRKGMEAGADDFLVKPFTRAELLACVEARLKRAEIHWRVEDRNLAKLRSSMLAQLPDELFTPLAGIMGLSEFLRASVTTLSLEEIQDLLENVFRSSLRLNRTLNNYLLILELDSAAAETHPSPALLASPEVNLAIQSGVDAVLARHNRPKGFTVVMAEAPLRVRADDLKIIVEELLDNACKFSRFNSPVTVSLEPSGTLIVTDQGRGIAPEQIQQMETSQQFDRKNQGQAGLGLGFVLVQKLTARSGAGLSIKSEVGKGTQVKVAFKTAE